MFAKKVTRFLEAEHHPSGVLHQVAIGAGELLEGGVGRTPGMDGAQRPAPEQFRELIGIDVVPLVPAAGPAPAVADDERPGTHSQHALGAKETS
jgi:hypothetical protein